MSQTFEVGDEEANLRLDVFVAGRLRDLSRSHIQKLIGTHAIRINDQMVKANYKTRAGDRVIVTIPAARPLTTALPEEISLSVIYEDDSVIVVNKPKGMVVHPAPGAESGTLVNALLAHCKDLSGIGGALRPGIVHRLDKDTSGLLAVAKTDFAHRSLSEQIQQRTAVRKYQALLWGRVPFKHAVIDAPIARHPADRKRMTVMEDLEAARGGRRDGDLRLPHLPGHFGLADRDEDQEFDFHQFEPMQGFAKSKARAAVTEIRLLEHLGVFSWVEAILQTGRTHQIRVHTAFAGYPIVGDTVYGGARRVSAEDLRGYALQRLNEQIGALHGQALHAYSLAFSHPVSNKRLQFHVEPPQEIGELVDFLRRIDED